MSKLTTDQIVNRATDLPTLPQIVINLMSAIEDPRSNAGHINMIMSNDPALASRVLKLVNSTFYSLPRKITSIRDAVVILGFSTVRSLAISASVLSTFSVKGFSAEKFWQQSLTYGMIAEGLEKRVNLPEKGNAFTLGLLQGIGKIILEQYFPQIFGEIITRASQEKLSFDDAEKLIIDASNVEVAAWLLARWRLPESLQLSIRYQNNPLACTNQANAKLAALVYFARHFYRLCGFSDTTDFHPLPTVDPALLSLMGFALDDEALLNAVKKQIEAAKNIFAELI